jgi:hypothetical protein
MKEICVSGAVGIRYHVVFLLSHSLFGLLQLTYFILNDPIYQKRKKKLTKYIL